MGKGVIGMTIRNGWQVNTLEYDAELCIGCGMCSTVCPHGVFALDNQVAALVRSEACIECGACQLNCPTAAITVDSGAGCATAMMVSAIIGRSTSFGEERGQGCAEA